MTQYRLLTIALSVLLAMLVSMEAYGGGVSKNEATVTMVQGTARVFAKGASAGRILQKGNPLRENDVIKLAEKSRLEMRFPDGTIMRLSEKSSARLNALSYDRQTKEKKITVDLSVGKLWASVKKLLTPDSSVAVRTSNAVAGVRGTVYRVNADEDRSVLVKVYSGAVSVANPPKDNGNAAQSSAPSRVSKPTEVPGPNEIPPPHHAVSLQEWMVIIKAMQQVSVSPQGVPSPPQIFDPKAEADEWVLWNLERDEESFL